MSSAGSLRSIKHVEVVDRDPLGSGLRSAELVEVVFQRLVLWLRAQSGRGRGRSRPGSSAKSPVPISHASWPRLTAAIASRVVVYVAVSVSIELTTKPIFMVSHRQGEQRCRFR